MAGSDLVGQFYLQYSNSVDVPRLAVSAPIPLLVQERLAQHALVFQDLPGLLQRALLWDAGFVQTDAGALQQVWTPCGTSMGDIALSADEMMSAGCTVEPCDALPATAAHEGNLPTVTQAHTALCSSFCSANHQLDVQTRCTILTQSSEESDPAIGAIWSSGAVVLRTPNRAAEPRDVARVRRRKPHLTSSRDTALSSQPLFVLEVPAGLSTNSSACSPSQIIPCSSINASMNAETQQPSGTSWCPPTTSPLLSQWLKEYVDAAQRATEPHIGEPSRLINSALSQTPGLGGGFAVTDISQHLLALLPGDEYQEDPIAYSSDLTRQFFRLHANNYAAQDNFELNVALPQEVVTRLKNFHLGFSQLSKLLQRALLWDSGFAVTVDPDTGSTSLVEVRVRCGLRMADIALNPAFYASTGCTWHQCNDSGAINSSPNSSTASYHSRACSPQQLKSVSLCAATAASIFSPVAAVSNAIPIAPEEATMWAMGNLSNTSTGGIPGMLVYRHQQNGSSLYAIHTGPLTAYSEDEDECSSRPASLTIPCVPYEEIALQSEWCRPVENPLVESWIAVEERQQLALVNLFVLAGTILVTIAMDLFINWKPRIFGSAAVAAEVPSLTSATSSRELSREHSLVSVLPSPDASRSD